MGRKDLFALLVLCSMTALLVLLVSPVFEAALDDSWNFALPTYHLLEIGKPVFDPFNSAAAVLHILWGALFCLLFDFSFSTCRIANIVLTLITSIVFYLAARQSGANEKTSFGAAAAFAANPILMVTSYTYQSDIAYLACAFGAVAFYLRFLNTSRHRDLFWASALVALSIWDKVHGVVLGAAALFYFLIARKHAGMKKLRCATAAVLPFASYMLFRLSKPLIHPVSTTLDAKMGEFLQRLTSPMVWIEEGSQRFFFILVALGIFCLPLFAGWFFTRKTEKKEPARLRLGVAIFWVVVIRIGLYWVSGRGESYPFHASMLRELPPYPDNPVYKILTMLAWPAGALFAYHMTLAAVDAIKKRGAGLLLFALLIPQALLLVPIKLFMDRYFLVLFPLAFLILIRRFSQTKFRLWAACIVIALFFAAGAIRIEQYKNANVAQWEGAADLMKQGVPSLNIDAGYAWTGWHNYEHSLAHPNLNHSRPGDTWYIFELCRSTDAIYKVMFFPPPPGDELIRKIPYARWFADEPDYVYVYKRAEAVGFK